MVVKSKLKQMRFESSAEQRMGVNETARKQKTHGVPMKYVCEL